MENIFKFMREGRYDMRLFLLRIGYGISIKNIKTVVQRVKAR